jgi:hypothetical protein
MLTWRPAFPDLRLRIRRAARKNPRTALTISRPECALSRTVRRVYSATEAASAETCTEAASLNARVHVHVVCGGGSGSALLRGLAAQGFTVTTGVLNRLDTDWETSRSLGLACVEEAPFSPVSVETDSRNRALMAEADLVILAELPFGRGNLKNLAAAVADWDAVLADAATHGLSHTARWYTAGAIR